jgi:hypothetical protein
MSFQAATAFSEGAGTTDDVSWKVLPRLMTSHPDSLVKSCVTTATEMIFLALYKDQYGRIYRPRRDLTEYENQASTNPGVSEAFIWFDVYIKRLTKTERERGDLKAGALLGGEKLTMSFLHYSKNDYVTVPEFKCTVEDVHWGTFVRTDLETGLQVTKQKDSLGCVKVMVHETYPRSLIMDSDAKMRKYKMPFAA